MLQEKKLVAEIKRTAKTGNEVGSLMLPCQSTHIHEPVQFSSTPSWEYAPLQYLGAIKKTITFAGVRTTVGFNTSKLFG